MALHRGIQSAIFYYVSCAPCSEVRVRKRRKQEAERNRADREELEAHIPGLYRQPDPSSTNPYWQTEIDAGPIPLRTRKRLAESSKAALSTRSNIASSLSVDGSAQSMERSDSAKSGLGQYQRPDEALWGSTLHEDTSLRPPSARQSSNRGLPVHPPRAMINDQPRLRAFDFAQNASINDLHPPTTRKVQSRDEVSWMMQPPPLPEIMSGKEVVPRRNTSNASRPSTAMPVSPRRSEHSVVEEEEGDEQLDPLHPLALPPQAISPVQRSKTLPTRHPAGDTSSSTPAGPTTRRIAARPHLATVLSESHTTIHGNGAENDEPQRAASFSDMPSQPNKWLATRVIVPRRESLDEPDSNASPANFDAWHSPEFELPEWIHEHTKREVRQRWSFDM